MDYEDDYDKPFHLSSMKELRQSVYYPVDDMLTLEVMKQVMAYPRWSLSEVDVISYTKHILKELFEKGE